MDTQLVHAQLTVEDVFKKWPQSFPVFRDHKTNCIGCFLQRFCTLQEVADVYEISLPGFLNELDACTKESNTSKRSIE